MAHTHEKGVLANGEELHSESMREVGRPFWPRTLVAEINSTRHLDRPGRREVEGRLGKGCPASARTAASRWD